MEDTKFFKCMKIREKLKEKIKAKIFIGLNNNTMTINITGFRGVSFVKYINDISDWIDFNKIVDDIVYEYRRFILDKFLY